MTIRHLQYLREILDHPFNRKRRAHTLWRYLCWNVGRRLLADAEYSIELMEGCNAVVSNVENYATLAYTCRLYDFNDMLFMLHFLRSGDGFGDFGANVGIYSLLAATRGARVLAVEPVDDTYERLCRNLRSNAVQGSTFKRGIGATASVGRFTTSMGGMNRVARGGEANTVEVQISTVDEIVDLAGFSPRLMKVDVEGYEFPLLSGAPRLLAGEHLRAIIIELNGSGKTFGYSDESVHDLLSKAGYVAHHYDPFTRTLLETGRVNRGSFNTLYVRSEFRDEVSRASASASVVGTPIGDL